MFLRPPLHKWVSLFRKHENYLRVQWGSNTAIGDITEAAGWKILNCSPDVLTQDIRLVCMGETSMCQHLFSGHGAVDTIVRLSEDCGKGPFARVQKSWIPADQSMPADIAARIVRRDGSQPQVQALTLDTNFTAVDSSKLDKLNFLLGFLSSEPCD
ncbi:hypothetical protein MSAN_00246200 [Mycena sanguinolenta]|uniref:Uncharacterized protein n=1 Tax=Mycena sanguinolenta TaxID=230812 RepID=A0A8H6ZMJ7_9AGAR|nr:hypothetical protein MSAN_00246200 [Mycena sanguinolenta]